ncbi:MAG: HD domain-containing protein [Planctomycetota bacterium]
MRLHPPLPKELELPPRKRYSVLRDPVHGDVYLTHEELRLLDTPEMQRLRGVKQLGSAYLVYPGAVHTRFEHSIGSLHVAQKMIEAIGRNADFEPAACVAVSEEEARVIRIASLLHDCTHIPFGHNFEDQDGIFWRHDSAYRFERLLGRETKLGRELAELGLADDVLRVLTKPKGTAGEQDVPHYWREIVSGTVCSDILDYLARDAYFTGLRLEIDPRVASYFKVDRRTSRLYIDLAKHDLLREDILSEIVRMLEARYYFSERVYYHHAKVVAGAMIARAVELALSLDLVKEEDFYNQTDASLLDMLDRAAAASTDKTATRVRELVRAYRERRLYKRACVFPLYRNEDVQEDIVERYFGPGGAPRKREVEERIQDLMRFASGREIDILLYCPAKRMQLKEARMHVRWPGAPEVAPLSTYAAAIPRLEDLRSSYRNLWKFYVLADTSDPALLSKIQEIAKGEFAGATNVYSLS